MVEISSITSPEEWSENFMKQPVEQHRLINLYNLYVTFGYTFGIFSCLFGIFAYLFGNIQTHVRNIQINVLNFQIHAWNVHIYLKIKYVWGDKRTVN